MTFHMIRYSDWCTVYCRKHFCPLFIVISLVVFLHTCVLPKSNWPQAMLLQCILVTFLKMSCLLCGKTEKHLGMGRSFLKYQYFQYFVARVINQCFEVKKWIVLANGCLRLEPFILTHRNAERHKHSHHLELFHIK